MKKLLFLAFLFLTSLTHAKQPRITIVIVIDQFGQHYLNKLMPYFTDGFRTLLSKGVVFEQAHHPQAAPVTATGHATLGTGAYAEKHGIIMNNWYNEDDKKVDSIDDDSQEGAVLSPDGVCDYGASPRTIMCDSISDSIVRNASGDEPISVYSLSYKSRAAIGMAGKQAKAIWFDNKQKIFTSSKSYFDQIPDWVSVFNKETLAPVLQHDLHWDLVFDRAHEAYQQYTLPTYNHSNIGSPIAGSNKAFNPNEQETNESIMFLLNPLSNKILLDLASTCLEEHLNHNDDRMLLWISISSFDKVGHIFGPTSLENIDMAFQLDRQIGHFMRSVQHDFGKENVMFVLSADHGASPIPENAHERGLAPAVRIEMWPVIDELNEHINEQFDIEDLALGFRTNQFYLRRSLFDTLDEDTQNNILRCIKKYVRSIPGVRKVWTAKELSRAQTFAGSFKHHFKHQLYPGRSGHIVIMSAPYAMHTNYAKGTCHRSPYAYDTHVPLIFYQPGRLRSKRVRSKVWTTQLAPTLGKMYHVPVPKTANKQPLPYVLKGL